MSVFLGSHKIDVYGGQHEPETPTLQTKSVTPTESAQTITADNGYDGLEEVDVAAISSSYVGSGITRRDSTDMSASGRTITAPSGYYASNGTYQMVESQAVLTSSVDSTGLITSTLTTTGAGYRALGTQTHTQQLTTQAAQTIHPSTTDQTIAAEKFLTGAQTFKAVAMANLLAENIKSGVTVKIGDSTDDDCVTSVTGTYTGTSPTLITKSITTNGTYNASSDSADGYSSVTVNVSGGGGASNVVTGTFKGTTTGAAMDVTLNYTGSGYPVAVLIYVADGPYNSNSTFYSLLQRYAIGSYTLVKCVPSSTPDYSSLNAKNNALTTVCYKSSSSNYSSYARGGAQNTKLYDDSNADSNINSCVRLRSKTKMSVYIAGTSYGFAANIEYQYFVIYSS